MSNASPNDTAKTGSSSDAMSAVGECPLKKTKMQLVPVRYGLVESLAADKVMQVPFKTKSRPIGIRLLRDGWLYVVVEENKNWLLHEYRVENGVITKLLWSNAEVSSDVRTSSVGEASLIFDQHCSIYTSYSELQWTAVKCSQVIKSSKDRKRFMQKVRLSSFNATKGAKDLLTATQASNLIAECAEKPQNKSELDYQDYEWEHKPLFATTAFTTINASVLPDYQKDHAYLVLNDDIGVLRDLAAYQSLVALSIEDWQSNETNYQKYVEGCYIETQLQISPEKVDQVAAALGSDSFSSELNEEQKAAVADWIREFDEKFDDFTRPTVGEKYRVMEKSLGPELMDKHREFLFDIQQQFEKQLQGVSGFKFWDGEAGSQGIKDVIDQEAMETFLIEEREKLAYWDALLKTISDDRTRLFVRFYYAAWYFDATISTQLGELLAAEYSCIQDICWNDTASALVAKELEKMPWASTVRGIFTLSADAYDKMSEEIAKKIKEAKDLVDFIEDPSQSALNDLGMQFNSLLTTDYDAAQLINLHEHLKGFSNLVDSSYTPAMTLALTDKVTELFESLNNGQSFNPKDVLRSFSGAAWLSLFKVYDNQGLSIAFANEAEIKAFERTTSQARELRKLNVSLRNRIRQAWAIHRRSGQKGSPNVAQWEQQRRVNQNQLLGLETEIHNAIVPYGEGPAKVGFHIKGLTEAQRADIRVMASDLRKVKQIKPVSSMKGWDGLAAVLAGFAIYNAVKSYTDYSNDSKGSVGRLESTRDIFSAIGACFGLAQGIRAGYDMTAVKAVESSAAKLVYGARLGRWTTMLGGGAYFFSGITSLIKSYDAYHKLSESLSNGDKIGTLKNAVDFSAEASMVGVNGYGAYRSAMVGKAVLFAEKGSRAAIWASNSSRLLSIGARVNLIGIALSAVQLGVTVIYNRYNLNHYMQWFQHSQWGDSPVFSSLQQSNEALAKISTKPKFSINALEKGNALSVTMPNITLDQLNDAEVSIAVYWLVDQQKNDWQPWTQPAAQQWVALSQDNQPLTIALPIFKAEANANHGIAIELHYFATEDSTEKTVTRFETINLSRVGLVNEVKVLKARSVNSSNLHLLTTEQITTQVS
jgi:hypothetical protein